MVQIVKIEHHRLSSLALFSIENGFLKYLMARNDFYNEVIEIFCEKTKRVELFYK